MRRVLLASVLALFVPLPVLAQPVPAQHGTASEPSAVALKLAQTINSLAGLRNENARLFDSGEMQAGFQADPDIAEFEKEYPGIIAYIVKQIQPVAIRHTEMSLPDLWRRTARLFDSEMTSSEIEAAYAYYSSPAGQRLINATHQNFDMKPLITELVRDPDNQLTSEGMTQGVVNAMPKIIAEMSSEDQNALMAFAKTSAFRTISKINPKVIKLKTEWSNESTAEQDAEIEAIAIKALEEFIAKADQADTNIQ